MSTKRRSKKSDSDGKAAQCTNCPAPLTQADLEAKSRRYTVPAHAHNVIRSKEPLCECCATALMKAATQPASERPSIAEARPDIKYAGV